VCCRLPKLSSFTIDVVPDYDNSDGDLDPVLALMHMHAPGVQSLTLQLSTSWTHHDETWASLGRMTNLTKLQLTFDLAVREQGWSC
jgi:hypothetical protein